MNTVRKVLENTAAGEDFYLLLGDFLDEFYRSDKDTKQKMIAEEPRSRSLETLREHLSFAAATAHKLANDYSIPVPSWVFKKQYYHVGKPFFGCRAKGNLRLLFMYSSPSEFKHRNLFVDENVLKRV